MNTGAPEFSTFGVYSGTFEANVLPLFTENGAWFEGSQACTGCHFANTENSYHEMDLSSNAGIMAGGDVLSEPPGVPILGQSEVGAADYNWEHAELKERLRNNRMPPGWEFDIIEENRDGPMHPVPARKTKPTSSTIETLSRRKGHHSQVTDRKRIENSFRITHNIKILL